MTEKGAFFTWEDSNTLILKIKVQTRASKDALGEVLGERLKVRITAAPIDGKANAHLVKYLAKLFKVPQTQIQILAGQSSQEKRLRIHAPKQLPTLITPD